MKHALIALLALVLTGCSSAQPEAQNQPEPTATPKVTEQSLLHEVYVSQTSPYAEQARAAFARLSDAERVAQLLVSTGGKLGKPQATLLQLIDEGIIGGIIYLANSLEDHHRQVAEVRRRADEQLPIPLFLAVDAEPSLFNKRIPGAPAVSQTASLKSPADVRRAVATIDSTIAAIGYNWNYAPVVDLGTQNAAIMQRSFGYDPDSVALLAATYVRATQDDGILACIKHFPGHGLISGDTHKGSVVIDGPMREYQVYEQILRECSPLSLMVGHITVRNNEYDTNGLPASLSPRITTDLLRGKLGYEGLVVTDALNMMAAATKYPDAPMLASRAGADVLLMPRDERAIHAQILAAIRTDEVYRRQVYRSVDRVLRAKAWLGLL